MEGKLLFNGYDKTLRGVLKDTLKEAPPLRANWKDVDTALKVLTSLYRGTFVGMNGEGIDKTSFRLNPALFQGYDVLYRAKMFEKDYVTIQTALRFAFRRLKQLQTPGVEPKNKMLLPRNLADFFYDSYKCDSVFLHLIFDKIYHGHSINERSKSK